MPEHWGGCLADSTVFVARASNESLDANCVALFVCRMIECCSGCLAGISVSVAKASNESLDGNGVAPLPLHASMLWRLRFGRHNRSHGGF